MVVGPEDPPLVRIVQSPPPGVVSFSGLSLPLRRHARPDLHAVPLLDLVAQRLGHEALLLEQAEAPELGARDVDGVHGAAAARDVADEEARRRGERGGRGGEEGGDGELGGGHGFGCVAAAEEDWCSEEGCCRWPEEAEGG